MLKAQPKFVFLIPHIQPFLLAGIRQLIANYDARVLLISWPLPEIAPVKAFTHENLQHLEKTDENASMLVAELLAFDADIVFGSGWMDKDYLKWCALFKAKGKKVVMGIDNQWQGSLQQKLHCLISSVTIRSSYTHAWVPGYFQYEYVRRLGFKREKILTRLYTVDTKLFDNYYKDCLESKKHNYPKNFLYVGRLVAHKAENMLKAFSELTEKELDGWKLIVVGNGPLESYKEAGNKNIVFKPFIQQSELGPVVKEAGAFCLLSSDEPWGMVIQEYAAAGLPLVLSQQCGAHYSFLVQGYNGYLCDGNSVEDIKEKMRMLIANSSFKLLQMGERSNRLGTCDDPDTWAATLMSIN